MEEGNTDKRSSMFTVRNAENAMITFTIFALFCFWVVFFHEILVKEQSFVDALYSVVGNISKIMAAATTLMIFEETIDIMFQRIRDTLKKEKALKAQVSAESRAEGRAEGKAEAYQEIAAWNSRRLAAEARGEKFTEPPPGTLLNG